MTETILNYIGGKWTSSATGKTFESFNPANGEFVAKAQASDIADIKNAIKAARKAFDQGPWRWTHGKFRAEILYELADLMAVEEEMIGDLIGREMGKPYRTAMEREVRPSIDRLRFFAGASRTITGEIIESTGSHLVDFIRKVPVGVCGLIVPWNDPIDLVIRKLGAALAVGCTVIVKAASNCPASTMALFKLIDKLDQLPEGVVNGITGSGKILGEYLASSTDVDKVSFTGGTETGRRIMELASSNMKKISLELGGKAPFILFSDANLEKALDALAYGAFAYAGQSCSAATRLIVHKDIHKEFLERLIEKVKLLRIGDPENRRNHIGPMVSEKQLMKTLSFIDQGKREGGDLVYGGDRLTEGALADGFFMCPTIFDNVKPSMQIAQEEIFGPVLCVMPFETEDEALEIANSTKYALQSAVWSTDINRCIRMSNKIIAGDVWINSYYVRSAEVPYGGIKQSGLGYELGLQGLQEYLVNKRVCMDTSEEFHTRIFAE